MTCRRCIEQGLDTTQELIISDELSHTTTIGCTVAIVNGIKVTISMTKKQIVLMILMVVTFSPVLVALSSVVCLQCLCPRLVPSTPLLC